MLTRSILVAALAAALIPAAALADQARVSEPVPGQVIHHPDGVAETCTALASQFDQSVAKDRNSSEVATAKQLWNLGESQCKGADRNSGVNNLRRAVADLGVTPSA